MSRTLQWLLWAVALVIGLNYLLNLRDELRELSQERSTMERVRSRELGDTAGVDWNAEIERARAVRTDWMSRLPVYAGRGLFNVGAMESMGAICEGLKLACQVALTDDAPTPGSNSAASAGPAAGSTSATTAAERGKTALPRMVSSARVKVTTAFQPESLKALVSRLESGDQLRTIDRITVTGTRMELLVRVFAIESDAARPSAAGDAPVVTGSQVTPSARALARLAGTS